MYDAYSTQTMRIVPSLNYKKRETLETTNAERDTKPEAIESEAHLHNCTHIAQYCRPQINGHENISFMKITRFVRTNTCFLSLRLLLSFSSSFARFVFFPLFSCFIWFKCVLQCVISHTFFSFLKKPHCPRGIPWFFSHCFFPSPSRICAYTFMLYSSVVCAVGWFMSAISA